MPFITPGLRIPLINVLHIPSPDLKRRLVKAFFKTLPETKLYHNLESVNDATSLFNSVTLSIVIEFTFV